MDWNTAMKLTANIFNKIDGRKGNIEIEVSENYRSIFQEDYVKLFTHEALIKYREIINNLAYEALNIFGRDVYTDSREVINDEGIALEKVRQYLNQYWR